MKAPTPKIDSVARAVAVVASVWFAFAAAWGMFGIPGGGHIGAGSAGNVMAAEQMIRWRIQYPAWGWYDGVRPPSAGYLCHHPFGQYYIPAALYWLFGHHDCLTHVPAVVMSAAMPPLLYGIGKARWGAPLGAVAAAGYVVVPIAVGFSNFWNLETICIFGALLFFWGHSRHMVARRRRYAALSLLGLTVACSGDWVGYLMVAPTIGWSFLRAFVLPLRWTPRFRIEPYARWWAISVAVILLSLAWWIGLFHHVGQIGEWLNAGASRGGGEPEDLHKTLRATLDARKSWIEFSFTPLAIVIGKVAAPVCLLRLLVNRWDEETYSLGILFGASIQYVVFKEGADIHIFWPHYFAPYFALALAQFAGAISAVVRTVARWFSRARAPAVAAIAALVVGLSPVAAMAHDGVSSLWVWRRTGGRYNDNGSPIESNVEFLYTLKKVVIPHVQPGARIDTHPRVGWGWEQLWTYQGEANVVGMPSAASTAVDSHPFWVTRASFMGGDEQRRVAAAAHVRIYGDTWVVDQREPRAFVDAFSLNEREPNIFEWFVYGGTEPMRTIGPTPDPWQTWEWRVHLEQPAQPPTGAPVTIDQLRIAHNFSLANGDQGAAARWRARIEQQLDLQVATGFDRGVRLLGARVTGGVQPTVEAWFECVSALGEISLNVRSTVEARAPFSLIEPDATDREMVSPASLPTKLWRPGYLYKIGTVLNHRIGRERYTAAWRSLDGSPVPQRADGAAETTLATVP